MSNVGVASFDRSAGGMTPGAAGAVVSRMYVATPAVLTLPAASVTVTRSVELPSGWPLRSRVTLGPHDAGTVTVAPDGVTSVQVTTPPASTPEIENAGRGPCAGDVVPLTAGCAGAVVSSRYVTVVELLTLPAASAALTVTV